MLLTATFLIFIFYIGAVFCRYFILSTSYPEIPTLIFEYHHELQSTAIMRRYQEYGDAGIFNRETVDALIERILREVPGTRYTPSRPNISEDAFGNARESEAAFDVQNRRNRQASPLPRVPEIPSSSNPFVLNEDTSESAPIAAAVVEPETSYPNLSESANTPVTPVTPENIHSFSQGHSGFNNAFPGPFGVFFNPLFSSPPQNLPNFPFSFSNSPCQCSIMSSRKPTSFSDWRSMANIKNCKVPFIRVPRSDLIASAVEAYKTFDFQTEESRRILQNMNIKVEFTNEIGRDAGGLLSDFFHIFFTEIIENSGLFMKNEQDLVITSPTIGTPENLDTYEAFGFYLGKALQNNYAVGYHFSDLIFEILKFGRIIQFTESLVESWDPQLISPLKRLRYMNDEELSGFNFDEFSPQYNCPVTRDTVNLYIAMKLNNTHIINSNALQLIMIGLGFARACPAHLIIKANVDLEKELFGGKALTADDLIRAYKTNVPRTHRAAVICLFVWIKSLSQPQLMKLFRFLTGFRTLPFDGFTKIPLKIEFVPLTSPKKLPQANTCNRILYLPAYTSLENAKEAFQLLLTQIESGDAFEFGLV